LLELRETWLHAVVLLLLPRLLLHLQFCASLLLRLLLHPLLLLQLLLLQLLGMLLPHLQFCTLLLLTLFSQASAFLKFGLQTTHIFLLLQKTLLLCLKVLSLLVPDRFLQLLS
jgi:hypothetical protein